MIGCEQSREQLPDYLSGELEAESLRALEGHLEECQPCQGHLSFLKGFRSKLAEAEQHQYPTDVHTRLLAALEQEKASKVVPLTARRRSVPQILVRYLAAAAVLCACGLGVLHLQQANQAPEAVASLVDHHDTCWHIAPSAGRDAQFNAWVDKLGKMPPTPTVSSELVAYDQRECPAGEVRAGHLLYTKGETKVSVYILAAESFNESYGQTLRSHSHDGREVVLKQKGEWVYGVVAAIPRQELESLVDTDHLAMLRQYLAQQGQEQAV